MYQWSSCRHTFGSRKWWVLSAGGWAMTGFPGYFTKVVPSRLTAMFWVWVNWSTSRVRGSGSA